MAKLSREAYLAERERRVEELTEAMADRVASIATGKEAQELVSFMARFRSRSPRNGMLIYQQWEARCLAEENPELRPGRPSMLAGYKAFQGMGRQVRKGEKGYQVLSPVTARFASATPKNADSWRRLGTREKSNPGEKVESRMVGVKPATVFDVSQTDGPEIPSLPKWEPLAPGEVPAGLRDAIDAEIGREGYSIVGSTAATRNGAEGSTNFVSKEVTFDAERPANEQAATLLHELGHIKLHSPESGDQMNSASHLGQIEFEAETFAHVMAGLHGMDTSTSSDAYAAGWTFGTTGADPSRVAEMTVFVAERVSRAVNETVERMPVAGDLSDGSLPKPDGAEEKTTAQAVQERRVRNALRMEAQAPAKIREELQVDEGVNHTVSARR